MAEATHATCPTVTSVPDITICFYYHILSPRHVVTRQVSQIEPAPNKQPNQAVCRPIYPI